MIDVFYISIYKMEIFLSIHLLNVHVFDVRYFSLFMPVKLECQHWRTTQEGPSLFIFELPHPHPKKIAVGDIVGNVLRLCGPPPRT